MTTKLAASPSTYDPARRRATDGAEGVEWCRRAAERGDDWAQEQLRELYAADLAVPLEPGEPDKWPKPEYVDLVLARGKPAQGCFVAILVVGAAVYLVNAIWGWRAAQWGFLMIAVIAIVALSLSASTRQ